MYKGTKGNIPLYWFLKKISATSIIIHFSGRITATSLFGLLLLACIPLTELVSAFRNVGRILGKLFLCIWDFFNVYEHESFNESHLWHWLPSLLLLHLNLHSLHTLQATLDLFFLDIGGIPTTLLFYRFHGNFSFIIW